MLFYLLIFLLLSNSITTRRDKSILYSTTTIIILMVTAFIAYDNFLYLTKGIGLLAGLFHNTATTYSFHIFIFLITSFILLGLHVRNHMKNLPIKLIFFLDKFIIYLSCNKDKLIRHLSSNRDKNRNKRVKIYRYLSIFFTLAFIILCGENITIINYLQGFICIPLVFITNYIIRNTYVDMGGSFLSLVDGDIHGVFCSIVEKSFISDSLTSTLISIGLCMLILDLILDNKSNLSIISKIKLFWEKKEMILLIAMGFFLLSMILGNLGILLIHKDSFILFIRTVFSRIILFKLIYALVYFIVKRKMNIHLLSLNILTVLFIICIVYVNVFIITPFIYTTFYCTTFYSWYVNKYSSGIVDGSIKMYNKDISHFIMQCSKVLSSNPIFRKLLTMLATIKPNLLSVRHTSFSELYPLSFKRSYNQWINSKYIIKPIKLRKFLPVPVYVFKPITLEHSTIVKIKYSLPGMKYSLPNIRRLIYDNNFINRMIHLSNMYQNVSCKIHLTYSDYEVKASFDIHNLCLQKFFVKVSPIFDLKNKFSNSDFMHFGKNELDWLKSAPNPPKELLNNSVYMANIPSIPVFYTNEPSFPADTSDMSIDPSLSNLEQGNQPVGADSKAFKDIKVYTIPRQDYYRQTEGISGKWDNMMESIHGAYPHLIYFNRLNMGVGQYINPSSPKGLGMNINNYPKPIYVNFKLSSYLVDPLSTYLYGKLPRTGQSMRWIDSHPTIWYDLVNTYKPFQDSQADYSTPSVGVSSKYSKVWGYNKATYNPYDIDSSSPSKSNVRDSSSPSKSNVRASSSPSKSNVRASSSPSKSNVRDSSSLGTTNVYNTSSGDRSYCHNTSKSLLTVNGDLGNRFSGTNIIISDKGQSGLSNLGSSIAVAGGLIGASIITATSELSTIAKLGIMIAGGVSGGASWILVDYINMISIKKLDMNKPEVAKSLEVINILMKEVDADANSTNPKSTTWDKEKLEQYEEMIKNAFKSERI